jgi:hypothetical protein
VQREQPSEVERFRSIAAGFNGMGGTVLETAPDLCIA